MADIEKDKKAADALEAETEGAEGERKAQPTVSDLMKNAAAALGDFADEVPATSVVAAPTVAEEGVEAVESAEAVADIEAQLVNDIEAQPVIDLEAQVEKKSRRKGKSSKAQESVDASLDADVSSLAAAAAEAMSEVQVEALELQAESQPVESLAVESLEGEEKTRRKGKTEKKSGKKGKKKSKDVEWSAETRDLDFVPDAVNEEGMPGSMASEEPALNAFEELARRVAATVGESSSDEAMLSEDNAEVQFESADAEMDAAEMAASDAILAEMAASEETDMVEAAPEAVAEAASEATGDMEQLGLGVMEEELDSAENDAAAEPTEFIEHDQLVSIIEALLFSTDKPVSIATIKQIFKGSNVRTKDINRALDLLASEYASPMRGVSLEEINGGYQLRTKVDNAEFLRRLAKTRPFRLSGPALEVMAIVAYKQPITKHEIDEIRGVESGHLLRALMERHLVSFSGKAENLPGKPMTYSSTRKFLEIFGLRNLKELPTLSEIDELLPEGIGEVEEKETLSELTDRLSTELTSSYSEGEDELTKINEQLQQIDTTSEFFEQEKQRERERKDRERAQDLREKLVLGDQVEEKDRRWLDRYETRLQEIEAAAQAGQTMTIPAEEVEAAPEVGDQLRALSEESAQSAAAAEEGAEAEDDLSDVDPAFFDEGDREDDLAVNMDWSEDGESGGEGDKD